MRKEKKKVFPPRSLSLSLAVDVCLMRMTKPRDNMFEFQCDCFFVIKRIDEEKKLATA